MKIKFRKLDSNATVPSYAKEDDAGMDLTATSIVHGLDYIEYGTSLTIQIPVGHVGLLFPRSSVSKKGLVLANSVGVVDCGYYGYSSEIKLRFKQVGSDGDVYYVGDRIGQLVVLPIPKIELVEDTDTLSVGRGGFGHTGD